MDLMSPLEKPSRIFHAVCAYWLISSTGFNANAERHNASSTPATAAASAIEFRPRPCGLPIARIFSCVERADGLLELDPERQLNRTRAADLIQRAEPATRNPACSQARCQCLRRLTEQTA